MLMAGYNPEWCARKPDMAQPTRCGRCRVFHKHNQPLCLAMHKHEVLRQPTVKNRGVCANCHQPILSKYRAPDIKYCSRKCQAAASKGNRRGSADNPHSNYTLRLNAGYLKAASLKPGSVKPNLTGTPPRGQQGDEP